MKVQHFETILYKDHKVKYMIAVPSRATQKFPAGASSRSCYTYGNLVTWIWKRFGFPTYLTRGRKQFSAAVRRNIVLVWKMGILMHLAYSAGNFHSTVCFSFRTKAFGVVIVIAWSVWSAVRRMRDSWEGTTWRFFLHKLEGLDKHDASVSEMENAYEMPIQFCVESPGVILKLTTFD